MGTYASSASTRCPNWQVVAAVPVSGGGGLGELGTPHFPTPPPSRNGSMLIPVFRRLV